jgi:hypothetical protein
VGTDLAVAEITFLRLGEQTKDTVKFLAKIELEGGWGMAY